MSQVFQLIQGGAGNTVSEPKAQTPLTPSPKARAVSLLAQREYSRQALVEKLTTEGQSPEELALALDQLQARGLVDDTRVAETLVNRRAAAAWASASRPSGNRFGDQNPSSRQKIW